MGYSTRGNLSKMPNIGLQNCNKCGLCLSVCPTYKVIKQEHASPRARLQLINFYKNKKVVSSKDLKNIISKCLMCGSCSAICPSGIDHYSQFMKMRTTMIHDHGEKAEIKSLIFLLAKEYRIKFSANVAKLGQNIIPQKFFEKYNLGSIPINNFPKLNKKPLRQAVSETITTDTDKKGSVLYFTGCATNYLFDQTGFSTIDVLKRMGYNVIIPESQTCCGIPMLFHGAKEKAKKNILTNIKCLDPNNFKPNDINPDDIKAIIVDCPTCGSALKNEYPALKNELTAEIAETASQISAKVIDIISFIKQESGNNDLLRNLETLQTQKNKKYLENLENQDNLETDKIKVTYHLPCHLKNSLQAPDNTETILKALPKLDYIKAVDSDECCGGGGTFFYEYPEVSQKMVSLKIENAKKTGAQIWLTDCPVCRINLAGNLKENDNIIVKHPVEMIGL